MKVETEVSAFVVRKDMVPHYKTLETAATEADEYDFMWICDGHYACKHGDKAYTITIDGDKIGCSCPAMTFHCKGNDMCKHLVAFDRRSAPQKQITDDIAMELIKAGWTGEPGNMTPPDTADAEHEALIDSAANAGWSKEHPEMTSDEDGEDNGDGDPVPLDAEKPEPPEKKQVMVRTNCPYCDWWVSLPKQDIKKALENHLKTCKKKGSANPESPLGAKMYSRTCPHCDERFDGTDLDEVKDRHREHIPICPENPANKQEQQPVSSKTEPTETPPEQKPIVKESLTPETQPEQEEETKMEEETKKTYPHPDGHVFESAEALLNYVDELKAKQTTALARQTVRHKPMIKGISPRLQEIGRIAVGEKGGMSRSGKSRLPTKLDHFIFTTLNKDEDDRYTRNAGMMEMFGENCTEIPIRLLYNDIELNFPTFYAKYARSGIKLRGDGENWTVHHSDGTREEIFDPNNERGFLDDPDVKPHGILTVLVEGQNSVGGVYKFRTTSWNSINNILSSLSLIKNMCGMLTYIPLKLVYRRMEVTPKGLGHKTWIPVVSVEFRGSIEELQDKAEEVRSYMTVKTREELVQIEDAVRDHIVDDESVSEQQDIASEFHSSSEVEN